MSDLDDAPCDTHGVPLRECGCDDTCADRDWLADDARLRMEAFGASVARQHEQAVVEAIGDPEDTVLE